MHRTLIFQANLLLRFLGDLAKELRGEADMDGLKFHDHRKIGVLILKSDHLANNQIPCVFTWT
jgi:hypothetical protein